MRKLIVLSLVLTLFLTGCSLFRSIQIQTPTAVLLPEDRIFTIKAGTEIDNLVLDGKPLGKMMFPYDMKLVSPNVLVAQELKLNKAILEKSKADANTTKTMTIWGSVAAFLAAIGGIFAKASTQKKQT